MKKIFILLVLLSISGFAQNNINYKALIKDGSGNVIANQSITVQFRILQGVAQTNVYQETQTPTTDSNGIIILNIGTGTVNSGVYATIDWGSDDHYLNVQIDTSGGTTFTDMGTTQFMTVPYAIHSLTSSSSLSEINDLSDAKSDDDGTNDGSSVFLGINAGLNDDSTDNGNVGIGFETLMANTTGNWNTANGYRSLYNNTTGYNNVATGFKSLFNNTEGVQNVGNGNITLFSNTTGSRNTAVGNNALYKNIISNNNVALGFNAGYNTLGEGNTLLGFGAGYNETGSNTLYIENSDADADTALIYGEFGTDNSTTGNILRVNGELQLGNSLANRYAMPTADGTTNQIMQTDGSGILSWVDTSSFGVQQLNDLNDAKSDDDGSNDGSSVFLGINAGLNDDSTHNQNIGIGLDALKNNTDGDFNTALGYQSLLFNISGVANTAIGHQSLLYNTATGNTAMGNASMLYNVSGQQNVAIGDAALSQNTDGNNNTALGYSAGTNNIIGNGNIFLGSRSGFYETGSNKLYIEDSNAGANSALIYGEFGTDNSTTGNILRVNGELQLGNSVANRYAMPTADGTTNQVMQTNGSGVLSWVDSSTLINGLLRADGNTWPTTGAGVEIAYDNSGGIGYIQSYDRGTSNWKDLVIAANEIDLRTNSTSRVTVQNDGKVKILVASDASGTPGTGSLEIANSLRIDDNEIITNQNTILLLQNDNNGDLAVDGLTLYVDSSANRVGFKTLTPSTDLHLKQSDNLQGGGGGITFESALDVINWKIYHSGAAISFAENGVRIAYIAPATGAYVTTSDRRLKKNIKKVDDDVLPKLSNIEIYRYHYLDQDTSEEKILGVMAQDIQPYFPELVNTDEEGNLGLNYAGLSVVAIKAIKEQQKEIEDLKVENELLKKRLDKIEAMLNK
ncbi:MAG: tail fiber domain-containing protein [Flavobacteriaceae bacterium]|nr:tail fiber domain-containing protein [Flavobacteriaceae bacterium]